MASSVEASSASLLTKVTMGGGVGLVVRIPLARKFIGTQNPSFHREDPLDEFSDIHRAKESIHCQFEDDNEPIARA